ncbi:MAG: DUF488 family protein [Deltaproteobacteria bacterium]|nr:DUF488 family protein [Deltaproteobacteria bacterium]
MVKTRRWNDPTEADDGLRLLVTRYRPRGVRKGDETWDEWTKELGPSRELHREYAKEGALDWSAFRQRYLVEMKQAVPRTLIQNLAARHQTGEVVTLLCFCADEKHCHRSLLKRLVEDADSSRRG